MQLRVSARLVSQAVSSGVGEERAQHRPQVTGARWENFLQFEPFCDVGLDVRPRSKIQDLHDFLFMLLHCLYGGVLPISVH